MTIRLRLGLVFVALTFATLVVTGFVFVRALESNLERGLNATLEARESAVASTVQLRGLTAADIHRSPLRLATVNGVIAQLVDLNGTLLDSSRGSRADVLISPAWASEVQARPVFVDQVVHLDVGDETAAEGNDVAMRTYARRVGHSNVIVVTAVARTGVDTAAERARLQLLLSGAVIIVLSGLGASLLIGAALRPVERMRVEAASLHERNAGAGVQVPAGRDEIARLGHTLNRLLARLQQAVAREREFVADAGHELRTPLTVLKGELELARRPGRSREELVETVEIAAEETDRLVRLTEDLLGVGRYRETGESHLARFEVAAVARAAVAALTPRATADQVTLVAPPDGVEVSADGDAEAIRQAVDNLLSNAIRHAPAGSSVTVDVAPAGSDVRIAVADEGPGFPQDFLPVAFERFTRADEARGRDGEDGASGSGLGLAIVRSIMTAHAGRASVGRTADGRTEVVLAWPRTGPTAAPEVPRPSRRHRIP